VAASGAVAGPVIDVSALRKSYRGTVVVDGIDLVIEQGEVFALLGPSGAGKTTTVEICEGFRRADSGDVRVLGVNPRRAGRDWKRRIGIVAQHTADFADLTVTEAIAGIAAQYGMPRAVGEVMEAAGLVGQRHTRCDRLTAGSRRRLDVALGVVGRPELLFLDEPTSGFEPQARHELWDLIADLNADGTTVVLTTHYLDEAERLADRVGVIAAGRILDVATPDEVGGRARAAARVRWQDADGPHEEQTTKPTELISRLASRFQGEIPHLVVERPTLEDVYARMIERANLRRAEQSRPVVARRDDV
jgi:ABC-2 type transport system ATP-binding protein